MLDTISHIISRILGPQLDQKLKRYFISGAYKSILLQAAITLITFATSLIVARATGDAGFGIYTIVFTWVSIASVFAVLGFDDLILKYIPIYSSKKRIKQSEQLLKWTTSWSFIVGIIIAIILLALAWGANINGLSTYKEYYTWAVWVIPLFALMHIWQATLRAHKQFGKGQIAEKFVQPISFFLLLILLYFLNKELTDLQAVIVRVFSFLITLLVAWWLVKGYYKNGTRPNKNLSTQWWQHARYFLFSTVLYVINTRIDIVFLSFYEVGEANVAHYNAALKISDIALVPFAVLYTVTAPLFSELHASGNRAKLQTFYTRTSFIAFVVVFIALAVLVVMGEPILSLFGDSFKQGYEVLVLMCVVKLIHVFVGPANYLMMMVGLEKEATYALVVSVGVTIFLHYLWIPQWQNIGAAWATLIGLLVFEIIVCWQLYAKMGLKATIFGGFFTKQ